MPIPAATTRDAIEDLETRTLSALSGDLMRLVYLASTRDYNTGRYWHEGLAIDYGSAAAEAALEACHRAAYESLAARSLENLVGELRQYTAEMKTPAGQLLKTWRRLQPFRVLIPLDSDSLRAALFCSNVKVALEIIALNERP